jgi:hypothetical protein
MLKGRRVRPMWVSYPKCGMRASYRARWREAYIDASAVQGRCIGQSMGNGIQEQHIATEPQGLSTGTLVHGETTARVRCGREYEGADHWEAGLEVGPEVRTRTELREASRRCHVSIEGRHVSIEGLHEEVVTIVRVADMIGAGSCG